MKKYIKKFIICTSLTTLILSTNVYGYEKKAVSLNVNGMLQPVRSNVINKEGHTLVAFRDLFEILDIDVDWNSIRREITATKDDKKMVINVDTSVVKLNDKYLEMPVNVEIIEDVTYLPLRFVCEAFGMKVDWDTINQKISIDTGKKEYIYLNKIFEKDDKKTMSIEEAIKIAKSKSSSIKNLNDALEYSNKLVIKLSDDIVGQNHYEPQIEGVLRNINNLYAAEQDKEINQKIIEDSIELSIISAVGRIKSLELNIGVLEETIKIKEENLKALELKHKYGILSENDLKQAKDGLKSDKIGLQELKNNLNAQQKSLNNTLDQGNDAKIDIDFKYDFSKLDNIDIDSFITRNKEGDISIQLLKKNLKRLEDTRENYSHTSSEEDRIKTDNDIKAAERKLNDAKVELENKMRTSFNNLLRIRDKDKTLKLDLNKAKDAYNKVSANYISGKVTLNQVKEAELAILNIEKQIEQNKIDFEIAFYSFEKPYLGAGASA